MNEVLICSKCKMRVNEWIIENMGLWLYGSDDYFVPKTIGWKCPNCEERNYYDYNDNLAEENNK